MRGRWRPLTTKGECTAYRAKTAVRLASRRFIHNGELIATDDPDVKYLLKQGFIVDVDEYLVERATATPGARRLVKIPKKKAAPKAKKKAGKK